MPVIIFFVIAAVFHIALKHTRYGKYVYAIGGNMTSAKVSGINVNKYLVIVYTIAGALSGLAVAAFPMAKNTGLAHTFATAADKTNVRRVLTVLCVLLGAALVALGGWALVLAACAVFVRYYHAAKNQFGGTTGDLAGWLQNSEDLDAGGAGRLPMAGVL